MKNALLFGKSVLAVLILCGWNGLTASAGAPAENASGPLRIKEKFGSSVFTVHAYQKMLPVKTGDKGTKKRRNVGTAFPLDNRGYLLTLNCVVRDAEKIVITGNRGEKFDAVAVKCDGIGRITVLKVDNQALFSMPPIRPVNSVKPGSKVVFLGVPPGKSLSTMMGVVQFVHESDGTIIVTVSGEPGTSGTPVFDETGKIVGLLAYHLGEKENPAAGLPLPKETYVVFSMEYVSLVARSIINNAEARGGWLGVSVAVNGGFIQNVVKASPADKCGIKPGDTIVEINGSAVSSPDDLVGVMSATRSGETVRLKILRSGEPLAFTVKLSEHPLMK